MGGDALATGLRSHDETVTAPSADLLRTTWNRIGQADYIQRSILQDTDIVLIPG